MEKTILEKQLKKNVLSVLEENILKINEDVIDKLLDNIISSGGYSILSWLNKWSFIRKLEKR